MISPTADVKIQKALTSRTQQVVVVLEDLYQHHNASSILRTCDAFGIQEIYVINNRNCFQFDPEKSRGMERYVRRHVFEGPNATQSCFLRLKQMGYLLAATSLRPGCVTVEELPIREKLALCFGTEEKGLSEEAHRLSDCFLRIPMYGMTQSFNVSVTVALSLQALSLATGPQGFSALPPEASEMLKLEWTTFKSHQDETLEMETLHDA